jgi:hypothetical protein
MSYKTITICSETNISDEDLSEIVEDALTLAGVDIHDIDVVEVQI